MPVSEKCQKKLNELNASVKEIAKLTGEEFLMQDFVMYHGKSNIFVSQVLQGVSVSLTSADIEDACHVGALVKCKLEIALEMGIESNQRILDKLQGR